MSVTSPGISKTVSAADLLAIRASTLAEVALWLEGQRSDVPAHGWELANALREVFGSTSLMPQIGADTPRDGTDILLWSERYGFAIAHWYEPWGNWIRKGEDPSNPETDERYGIGADVPTHWSYLLEPTVSVENELSAPRL